MLIALIIIITIICIISIIFNIKFYNSQKYTDSIKESKLKIENLQDIIDKDEYYAKELENNIQIQEKTLSDVKNQIQDSHLTFENILIEQKEKMNKEYDAAFESVKKNIKDKNEEYNKLISDLDEVKKELNDKDIIKKSIILEIDKLKNNLSSILQQNNLATERLNGSNDTGRYMEWTSTDKEITELLEKLKFTYPFLSPAFSKIEWENIWQSKFQAMTIDIKPSYDKCGIYRIWTEEDGIVKSYVGQAKKIRERWSQHIKKMLGVAIADNHKFYSKVKPYNAHFEIIEECKESELNDKEHYWIEYYNCVSSGYNTKK